MNKPTFELLKEILLQNGKAVKASEVSERFAISQRTLYNYWDVICAYLNVIHAADLIAFNGHDFRFHGNQNDFTFLVTSMSSLTFYEYKLSKEERVTVILIILADSDQYVTIDSLQKILCVSRNTVIGDIKFVRDYLNSVNCHFSENKQSGFLLETSESQRRQIIFDMLDKINAVKDLYYDQPCNPCVRYVDAYLRLGKYRNIISSVIDDVEKCFLVKISDFDYYFISEVLSVMMERTEKHHYVEETSGRRDGSQFELIAEFITHALRNMISDNKNETDYFIQIMESHHVASHFAVDKESPHYIDILVQDLLKSIQPYFKADLLNDEVLKRYLTAHIDASYHRMINGESLQNPYLDSVKNQYPEEFSLLKKNIYILENGLNVSFSDPEIAYILMHILASQERYQAQNYIPAVIVACAAGSATGNLLAALLQKNFNVNIIGIEKIHHLGEVVKEKNPDLVVTNVQVPDLETPSVVVNGMLDDNDIAIIKDKINTIVNKKAREARRMELPSTRSEMHSDSISVVFSEDMIRLDYDAVDWQEAIIAAGELLLWNRKITVNYLHQMINLVMKYGPYMVIAPGVALAHASSEDGALEEGFSLVRLKKPVTFGKEIFDPVSIVIGCATLDSVEFANTLLNLMNFVRKPDFVKVIQCAQTKADIIRYLKDIDL